MNAAYFFRWGSFRCFGKSDEGSHLVRVDIDDLHRVEASDPIIVVMIGQLAIPNLV